MNTEETIGALILERRRVALEGYREMLPIESDETGRYDTIFSSYNAELRAINRRLEELGIYFDKSAWDDLPRWLGDGDDGDDEPEPVDPVLPQTCLDMS